MAGQGDGLDGLELRLLGGLAASRGGRPLTGFRSRKAAALLAYLAVTGRPQARAHLAALLWGEGPEDGARANLRNALANLTALVGAHLAVDRQGAAFVPGTAWVDVAAFEARLRPPAPGEAPPAAALAAAAELYAGDLLAGVDLPDAPAFDEWLAGERARLRGRALDALYALAAARRAAGDAAGALAALRRLLALEPWHEAAHREVMAALAGPGRRARPWPSTPAAGRRWRRSWGWSRRPRPAPSPSASGPGARRPGRRRRRGGTPVAPGPPAARVGPGAGRAAPQPAGGADPAVGREAELAALAGLLGGRTGPW